MPATYRPPPGLKNPHVQTIASSVLRKAVLPGRLKAFLPAGTERHVDVHAVRLLVHEHPAATAVARSESVRPEKVPRRNYASAAAVPGGTISMTKEEEDAKKAGRYFYIDGEETEEELPSTLTHVTLLFLQASFTLLVIVVYGETKDSSVTTKAAWLASVK